MYNPGYVALRSQYYEKVFNARSRPSKGRIDGVDRMHSRMIWALINELDDKDTLLSVLFLYSRSELEFLPFPLFNAILEYASPSHPGPRAHAHAYAYAWGGARARVLYFALENTSPHGERVRFHVKKQHVRRNGNTLAPSRTA